MEIVLQNIYDYVDRHKERYIDRLREFIAIKSVSETPEHAIDCEKAIRFAGTYLQNLGFEVKYKKIGKHKVYKGDHLPLTQAEDMPLPDVLLASWGNDITKKTLLYYAHVDVKTPHPATHGGPEVIDMSSFDLKQAGGYFTGLGVSDSKGPALAFMQAVDAILNCSGVLPVNLKVLMDAGGELGSPGIFELFHDLSPTFFKDVNYLATSQNHWLTDSTPCVTYGYRGLLYFYVTVEGGGKLLHSGTHGGATFEPMTEMVALLSSLVDSKGTCLVPGIMSDVKEPTPKELQHMEEIKFDPRTYSQSIKNPYLTTYDKMELLKRRWYLPSVTIHGIEGSYDKPGAPTWIPQKVIGKFSLRLVLDQKPKKEAERVIEYLRQIHKARDTKTKLSFKVFRDGCPFETNSDDVNVYAARKAVRKVWSTDENLTRDGATFSVVNLLRTYARSEIVLIPIASPADAWHEHGERISETHYFKGIKTLASYMFELSAIEYQSEEEQNELMDKMHKLARQFLDDRRDFDLAFGHN